jgi:hypothetical protein
VAVTHFDEGSETASELMPLCRPNYDAFRATAGRMMPQTVTFDAVQRPAHYAASDIECIDAIAAALGPDAFIAYCRGNAMKYAWRTGKKANADEDLRKGAWYLNKAADALEARHDDR